ncbi:MAG: hypothetical protein OEU84_07390 [Xanthomonadales bacterium]|nr:hypothetical protein [Xanthomonadales bacterium]MDH4019407.1 hypothetical protein [Xanthomonadales bacterium]
MVKSKPKKKGSRLKGGLLITLTIVFVVTSGIYFLTTGVRDAKRVEQKLIDRFGWAEQYTPSPDGSISPQRIEAFIRIREALQADCDDYQAVLTSIAQLQQIETDKDSSTSDAASTGLQGLKSAFSAGPRMVKFSTNRNQALLNEEMGIGEYLYIYLTSYGEQLAKEPDSVFSKMEEAYVSERARKEFMQILSNQQLALQTNEFQSTYPGLDGELQMEIDALKDGSHSAPWPNGPIGKARESLAPYQSKIDGLFCSGIVKIELLQKNRGFNFEG